MAQEHGETTAQELAQQIEEGIVGIERYSLEAYLIDCIENLRNVVERANG